MSNLQEQLDAVLAEGVAAGAVPGVTAAVTDRAGLTYEGGFGRRSLAGEAPMTADTVVAIASMTKAITGAAAMQLVEQSRLGLDTPASEVLALLGDTQVLEGFDADGQPKLRAPKRPITLRHLLTHTAGFGYEVWSADLARYQQVTGTPSIFTCETAALNMPLLFDPGDRWEYGINIDFAGQMVEAVSGQRLGEYLQANLFEPLGMTSTAFKVTPDMAARRAAVHVRAEDGSLVPIDFGMPQEPGFEMGGGGLYSTVADYSRFVRMILNDGRADDGTAVLRPETVAQMVTNNMGANRVTLLRTVAPGYSCDAEFFPGVDKTWGLSFQINEQPAPTGRPAGGLMWAGLANSYYWIDRQNGIGGVYASQIFPFADQATLDLYLAMETAVYQHVGEG